MYRTFRTTATGLIVKMILAILIRDIESLPRPRPSRSPNSRGFPVTPGASNPSPTRGPISVRPGGRWFGGGFGGGFTVKKNCSIPMCSSDGELLPAETHKQYCCMTCSCHASCGYRRDCCFDGNDTVDVVNTYQLRCVDTVLFQFYMMDKCFTDDSNTPFYKDGCNGLDSIVSPVSSASKHRAYINADCARCNGADDYEQFDVRFKCKNFSTFIEVAMGLRSHTVCIKEYMPTAASNLWMKNYICDFEFESSPANYVPKDEQLANGCSSLTSPIYNGLGSRAGVYKNVFCVSEYSRYYPDPLCSDPLALRNRDLMMNQNEPNEKSVQAGGDLLTVYRESFVSGSNMDEPCNSFTIKDAGSNGCRPVYCPETKTRINDSCKSIIPFVTGNRIVMQLKFVPIGNESISAYQLVRTTQTGNVYQWLMPPCVTPSIGFMYVSTATPDSDDDSIVKDIVYQLDITSLFKTITWSTSFLEDCFAKEWYVKVQGTYYNLSASLDRFRSFVADGRNMTQMALPHGVEAMSEEPDEEIVAKRYHLIAEMKPFVPPNGEIITGPVDMYLTKLHFCDYVVLYPNEVDILFNSIQIKHNCVILWDNEFNILSGDETNQLGNATKFIVKVCVEDYVKAPTSICHGENGVLMMASNVLLVALALLSVIA